MVSVKNAANLIANLASESVSLEYKSPPFQILCPTSLFLIDAGLSAFPSVRLWPSLGLTHLATRVLGMLLAKPPTSLACIGFGNLPLVFIRQFLALGILALTLETLA